MIRTRTIQPQPAPSPKCIKSLVDRMADDMREMAFAGQNVSVATLVERGWSERSVAKLSGKAVTIARRQSVRRLA
jgi:hypothetical protein